jgi:hypothetical protein
MKVPVARSTDPIQTRLDQLLALADDPNPDTAECAVGDLFLEFDSAFYDYRQIPVVGNPSFPKH